MIYEIGISEDTKAVKNMHGRCIASNPIQLNGDDKVKCESEINHGLHVDVFL